ncbi:MAG: hypothetical protein ABJF50_17240 [Paracoccaceae bacterium]
MIAFKDKYGRAIEIEVSDCSAEGYHAGRRIGDVHTTGVQEVDHRCEPLPAEITGWDIDREFRRAGVATELVRLLSEEIGPLSPGKQNEGRGGENALTDEGLALTTHCQRLGYVLPFPSGK